MHGELLTVQTGSEGAPRISVHTDTRLHSGYLLVVFHFAHLMSRGPGQPVKNLVRFMGKVDTAYDVVQHIVTT